MRTCTRSARAHGDRLVLELSRLTFIDASGLRLLLRHHTQTRRAGGCLALAAPHPASPRFCESPA
ncbi:hypothetical protein GCM10029978_046760 [Actinoallomurus acanthiterrae]